ncbi:ligand-gated channel [Pseudooceanicola sediminis]|uniref:Ligand-gated channel n=1 Tax=Pseudooceanicola sediminis TaxID=2211117 RepID=A0A399J4T4_9RHOB|nr:TonB-dependent receptor plug domain-containing protein [Pseudooceanicola sediminis]KAA2315483.1 TonB-dependent receptor plug domain-containing protein [Puniceibacterium sp. HSS470]RII40311.1 ligand-gated channel [Pseudooceanicola sediminis]|tara:strand:- start:26 stop:1975 length:1950 start_codon:yes stop_codon:yes gene_type:complete
MDRSATLRRLLLGSVALVLPHAALAQSEEITLAPIVVESDREVQTQTATPVTVIDQEEIDDRQASTTAELLDSVPGVNLVNGSTPGGSAINIRGMGAWSGTYGTDQTVQIIVDGATSGAEELYRIGTQLYTDPALYKQAEVIRGSVGTFEYGSGAIGGMVRFDTKDASDFTNGQDGFAARQYLGYNSNGDGLVTSSTLAWQASDALELLFNYTWREQGAYEDGNGETVENTDFATPSYLAKGTVHFGQDREHSLTLSYSDTQSSEKDVPYDQFGSSNFGNVDRDVHSKTSVLKYSYDSLNSDLVNVDVILSRAQQTIDQESSTGSTMSLLNADQDYVTTKLTAKNTMEFVTGQADHRLRMGAEYILKDRLDASSAPGGDDERHALFLVDDITFGGFTFSPAVRFEDQDIDGSEYGYGTYHNTALMGGASLRHQWASGFAVFGSWSYTEGMPILDDLTNAAYMTQSQKAETWELGVSFDRRDLLASGDRLALKVNAYHTDVWDVTSYSNITDLEVEGVEIEASYATDAGYYGDLNASFANGYNRTPDAASNFWSQQPADKVRLGLGKRFDSGLNLKWEGVWALDMDRATTPTPGVVLHNVSVGYTADSGMLKGVDMRLGVENLLDEYYQPHLATRPAPGRTVKVSLGRTF